MPEPTVEVRSEVFRSRPEEGLPPVVLRALDERVTVEELIGRTVEEQVRELRVGRDAGARQARQRLDRQYLTWREISDGAEKGAVRYPSDRNRKVPEIDPET